MNDQRARLAASIEATLRAWPVSRGAIARYEVCDGDSIIGSVDAGDSAAVGIAELCVQRACDEGQRKLLTVRAFGAARGKAAVAELLTRWKWSARPEDDAPAAAPGFAARDVVELLKHATAQTQSAHDLVRELAKDNARTLETILRAQADATRQLSQAASALVASTSALVTSQADRATAAVRERDEVVGALREAMELANGAQTRVETLERELADDPARMLVREAVRELGPKVLGAASAMLSANAAAAVPVETPPAQLATPEPAQLAALGGAASA